MLQACNMHVIACIMHVICASFRIGLLATNKSHSAEGLAPLVFISEDVEYLRRLKKECGKEPEGFLTDDCWA
jgi:hypothetical protein